MDQAGGYYDSGYIQLPDFFGDGTRLPFVAVSPYAKIDYVDHTYYDYGSIIKFIETNWKAADVIEAKPRQSAQSSAGLWFLCADERPGNR